jgi:hypothetical protein
MQSMGIVIKPGRCNRKGKIEEPEDAQMSPPWVFHASRYIFPVTEAANSWFFAGLSMFRATKGFNY